MTQPSYLVCFRFFVRCGGKLCDCTMACVVASLAMGLDLDLPGVNWLGVVVSVMDDVDVVNVGIGFASLTASIAACSDARDNCKFLEALICF